MCQQKTCLPILRRLQNTDSHPERFIRREFFPCLPKHGRDVERFFLFRHSGFREQDWAENEAGTFIRCYARIELTLRDVSVPVRVRCLRQPGLVRGVVCERGIEIVWKKLEYRQKDLSPDRGLHGYGVFLFLGSVAGRQSPNFASRFLMIANSSHDQIAYC